MAIYSQVFVVRAVGIQNKTQQNSIRYDYFEIRSSCVWQCLSFKCFC